MYFLIFEYFHLYEVKTHNFDYRIADSKEHIYSGELFIMYRPIFFQVFVLSTIFTFLSTAHLITKKDGYIDTYLLFCSFKFWHNLSRV